MTEQAVCSQNVTAVLIRPYCVFVVREKIKMTNDWRKKEISQGSKHIQDSWTPKPSDELMILMTVNFLFIIYKPVHTVSFDWLESGLEWILLEFCLLKHLIFYQKLLWNIRSRLNSSTFCVFRSIFSYVWSKLKLCT